MRASFAVIVALITLHAVAPASLLAEIASNPVRCSREVKECFMRMGEERSACFYNTSKAPACVRTDIGALALQRWAFSPGSELGLADGEESAALSGPRLIDPSCIAKFDALWSSYVMRDEVAGPTMEMLRRALDLCNRVDMENLPAP